MIWRCANQPLFVKKNCLSECILSGMRQTDELLEESAISYQPYSDRNNTLNLEKAKILVTPSKGDISATPLPVYLSLND
jgi:hypothetical protein